MGNQTGIELTGLNTPNVFSFSRFRFSEHQWHRSSYGVIKPIRTPVIPVFLMKGRYPGHDDLG